MLHFRSAATMTPQEAERVVRSWALLHNSGILGPHDVQESCQGAGGAGTAALPLCQAAQGRHLLFKFLTKQDALLAKAGSR